MRVAIEETDRRRKIQMDYNKKHGIVPETVKKSKEAILQQTKVADRTKSGKQYYIEPEELSIAADPVVGYMDGDQIDKMIKETRSQMEKAAKELDFIEAARLRDELQQLENLQKEKKG